MTISFRTEEQWIFIVAVVMSSNLKWIACLRMGEDGHASHFDYPDDSQPHFLVPTTWSFISSFPFLLCSPQMNLFENPLVYLPAFKIWLSLSSGLPLFGILLPRAFQQHVVSVHLLTTQSIC